MTEDEKRIFDSLSNLEEQQWREIENKIKGSVQNSVSFL